MSRQARQFQKIIDDTTKAIMTILDRVGLERSRLKSNTRVEAFRDGFRVKMPSYYIYADRGRRAGKAPPFKAIFEWVKYYNIKPQGMTQRQFAWLVVGLVARRGTKGKFFMKRIKQIVQFQTKKYIKNLKVWSNR
jgi:hypothetical protein